MMTQPMWVQCWPDKATAMVSECDFPLLSVSYAESTAAFLILFWVLFFSFFLGAFKKNKTYPSLTAQIFFSKFLIWLILDIAKKFYTTVPFF